MGREFFKITDKDFVGTDIDLRAVCSLQIAGIYYLILHAKVNGSTFCEIDINTQDGKEAIKTALAKVINLVYKEVAENN